MSALPNDLESVLRKAALVRDIDVVPRGHTRIETGFRYPDGTRIEVFIPRSLSTGPATHYKLTDFGQTMAWLLNLQLRPWLSKKRRLFLEEAIETYGARLSGGALELDVGSLDDLPSGIVLLGQACLRVSDLVFTRRAALQSTFSEQFEEVLEDSELQYETAVELETRRRKVKVDFLVSGARTKSAVLTLASGTPSAAHQASNEILSKLHDLAFGDRPEQRVTVYDDSLNVYREPDLERLKDLSDVIAFSDRNTLRELLAA